jgi:hypothetical protein
VRLARLNIILTIPKSGLVKIEMFEKLLDIAKIVSYTLEVNKGSLILKFYDHNGKVIKPYASKKENSKSKKPKPSSVRRK